MANLTREAASQQGTCQVMLRVALRVARARDNELTVELNAIDAAIANALFARGRV